MKAYDLIVVGAGPAGSTMAGLLKKHDPSARVLILESSPFPRHKVGESLLPGMIPVLKELGVWQKINDAGFPKKFGVVFVWGEDRKPWDADFNNLNLEMLQKHGRLLDAEFSWQVLRSRYDQILLDHAVELGVEARMGWKALAPIEEKGVIVGVVAQDPEGRRHRLRCETLADCSGQNGFLAQARKTRAFSDDLKNVAAYAYFKGAKWKFEYSGHPDKTKIFVCSVPQGWFWYIPLSPDLVSVGLVSKAEDVKRRKVADFRAHFFDALKDCGEIWPLLQNAQLLKGVDAAEPERDFFTARDFSYVNERACGPGWVAAGDAAFFIDPLLSSGVMMAHLSGHRAAYTINTARREKDPAVRAALWGDYDRFCKEISQSLLALVRYWYHNDPNAKSWWGEARKSLTGAAPVDLSDKMSFVAVAAGLTYYFERAYTSQTMIFGSGGPEHTWQWEGTKLELKRWTRQILAIVETGFLKAKPGADERLRAAEESVALRAIPGDRVPRWVMRRRVSTTFLPAVSGGTLEPIHRVDLMKAGASGLPAPKRVLPLSYIGALSLVDGKRTVGQITDALLHRLALPRDVVEGQVFRLLKDLAVLGAVSLDEAGKPRAGRGAAPKPCWAAFRAGETLLREGDPTAAERALTKALRGGMPGAWVWALRGEARRHLGRAAEARADLDEALRRSARAPEGRGSRLSRLIARFDAGIEQGWVDDRIRILRAKLLLAEGDALGARADAEAALRANPRQSEAYVLRAKASRALGDLSSADRDLRSALAIETAGKKGEG